MRQKRALKKLQRSSLRSKLVSNHHRVEEVEIVDAEDVVDEVSLSWHYIGAQLIDHLF